MRHWLQYQTDEIKSYITRPLYVYVHTDSEDDMVSFSTGKISAEFTIDEARTILNELLNILPKE